MKQKYFKFLDFNLASYHNPEFFYPSPIMKDGKWKPSEWITEKNISDNSEPCGKGLHLMKILCPKYGRYTGNCFEAEGKDLLGEDTDKARFKSIRLLRPVNPKEIFKSYANLSSADLSSANLSSADLSSADLRSANLRYADLRSANLRYADLRSANLRYADLSSANLRYADLSYANLSYANLSYANLSYANLRSANLSSADLSSANLRYADLSYANLSSADLSSANLSSADLSSADLRSANLRSARNINESFNIDKAYWNKFTQIDEDLKHQLSKDRFLN